MPAVSWTDEPRKAFLVSKLPGYANAQEERQTKAFLSSLHEEYFKRFPEPDETKKGAERQRIVNWYGNHSSGRVKGKRCTPLVKNARRSFTAMLLGAEEQRRKQKLQATQAYSELYWQSKLHDIVSEEWKLKLAEEPGLTKRQFLPFMNSRVKELFNAEPADVHAEVEHYRQSSLHAGADDDNIFLLPGEDKLDSAEQEHRVQARKLQAVIDNVQPALTEIAKIIEEHSGLKCHFMVAGPEPRRKGRIVNITVTAGKSIRSSKKFTDHSPLYKPNVANLWTAFVKSCFTQEERNRFLDVPFPGYEEVEDSHQSTSVDVTETQQQRTSKPLRTRSQKPDPSRQPLPALSTPSGEDVELVASDREIVDGGVLGHYSENDVSVDNSDEDSDEDSNVDEEDYVELMSKSLPPERRVVDRRANGGFTKYKTQAGSWVSYYELKRLANMARNTGLIAALGISEAKASCLTTRKGDSTARTRPAPQSPIQASTTCASSIDGNTLSPVVSDTTSSRTGMISTVQISPTTLATSHNSPAPIAEDNHDFTMDIDTDLVNRDATATFNTTEPNNASFDNASASLPLQMVDVQSTSHVDSALRPVIDLDSLELSTFPSWLTGPAQYLAQHFRGETEDDLLSGLFRLEMAWSPLNKKMGSDDRPIAVSWWLKNARRMSKVPPQIDLASFPEQIRQWWKTALPSWRVPHDSEADWPLTREVPVDEDWHCARRGGPNGLFLVVMCLYWWRTISEADEDRVAFAEYLSVAEDVVFVFGEILKHTLSVSPSTPVPSRNHGLDPSLNESLNVVSTKTRKCANRVETNRFLRSSKKNARRSTRAQGQ